MLSDKSIFNALKDGSIVIEPFNVHCLGANSYDVHLSKHLAIYDTSNGILDAKKECELIHTEIGKDGFILEPNRLYLGTTIEYTESKMYVPKLEGKSSTGRLGIQIHLTAGLGDVGFKGYWTLEIVVAQAVKVYRGMPIGQLTFESVQGEVVNPYDNRPNSKYINKDQKPQGSKMYLNDF